MFEVFKSNETKNLKRLANDLYRVYFKLLGVALQNPDIEFIKLKNIDKLIIQLAQRFEQEPNYSNSWQRNTKKKFDQFEIAKPEMDKKYERFLNQIPEERIIS